MEEHVPLLTRTCTVHDKIYTKMNSSCLIYFCIVPDKWKLPKMFGVALQDPLFKLSLRDALLKRHNQGDIGPHLACKSLWVCLSVHRASQAPVGTLIRRWYPGSLV